MPVERRSAAGLEGAGRRARDDEVHGFAGGRAAAPQDPCGTGQALSPAFRRSRAKHEKHLEHAMRLSTKRVTLGLVAALGIWGAGPAQSAEITVFLNQATES